MVYQNINNMKKFIVLLFLLSSTSNYVWADKEIDLIRPKGDDRTETTMPPKASFNEETNEVILAIEADNFFTMEVLDIYGTKVYSCPVMMVDGTPTNYVLPQLPAGIYTLKVESNDVSYEGTLVIE